MRRTADGELFYSPGFPVGRAVRDRSTKTGPRSELNNHWNIILEYHPRPKEGNNRIVGVVVWPQSIDSLRGRGSEPDCSVEAPLVLATGGEQRVAYTYSVTWRVRSPSPSVPLRTCDLTGLT